MSIPYITDLERALWDAAVKAAEAARRTGTRQLVGQISDCQVWVDPPPPASLTIQRARA